MIYRGYRWTMFFDMAEKISCPNGHPMSIKETWSGDDLVCDHKGSDGREDCGRRIYLHPIFRFRATPLFWACEVSAKEMQEMKDLNASDAILAYLGLKNRKDAA